MSEEGLEDICAQLIEVEACDAPYPLVCFLGARSDNLGGDQSLGFYAYSYQRAFEELFRIAYDRDQAGVLRPPLLLLCRHSVELSIKSALETLDPCSAPPASPPSHNLLGYWARLLEAMQRAGLSVDDEFTASCTAIVEQLHAHDARGDRFRYPASPKGQTYPSTLVSLDVVFRGHWRLTSYCEAAVEMARQVSATS